MVHGEHFTRKVTKDMTREKKWTLAVLAAFAGASFVGTAYAPPEETHALTDTVVTAQRREKRDLDTPATTTIITAKEIEKAATATYSKRSISSSALRAHRTARRGRISA